MKKYEYRNLHIANDRVWISFDTTFGNPKNLLDETELLNVLNEWGNLNWELIDLDIGGKNSFAMGSFNIFFLFRRELNDDLTPNKNNKCEYRVVCERTLKPFTKEEQDKYFLEWIKEGFELIKNINIKLENTSGGVMYFPIVVYIFKKKISNKIKDKQDDEYDSFKQLKNLF